MLVTAGNCKLDIQLVSQEVESIWLSALYPVNAMRNRALAGATTDVSQQLLLVKHAGCPMPSIMFSEDC